MPVDTLPDNDQDARNKSLESDAEFEKKYNAAQTLKEMEKQFPDDSTKPSGDSADQVRDGEEHPAYKSTYGGKKTARGRVLSSDNMRAIIKKRGVWGIIGLILFGGGLTGAILFSPGILLVQMKEALVNRLDYQFTSTSARTKLLLGAKVSDSIDPSVCADTASIECQRSTVSPEEAQRLRDAGIEVEDGADKYGDRIKPKNITYNNKTVPASEFSNLYDSDSTFRQIALKAYDPHFAGFADDVSEKVFAELGDTKQRVLSGTTDEERANSLQEDVKNGKKLVIPPDGITCTSTECVRDSDGSKLSAEEAAAARAGKAAVAAGAAEAANATDQAGVTAINKVEKDIAENTFGGAANFIKITGAADTACQVYSAVQGLGYAAKTVRALQLARYAMAFVNMADKIKDGTADGGDVAYMAGIFTDVTYDAASAFKRTAAMDSFGMQYALYGTLGKKTSFVSQFMAGGGLTGELIQITDYINKELGGGAVGQCRNLNNGWVQLGSAAAGIVLLAIPGVDVAIGVADGVKIGLSVAAQVALVALPDMLKDIVSGNVTKGIVGEDAGNAVFSGFGTITSKLGQRGGNAPLSIDDAVKYADAQNTTVAQYAADQRIAANPLDASNPYTFLGTITSQLLPTITDIQGGAALSSLSSFGSAVTHSFSSILPSAGAASDENLKEAFSSSGDADYTSMGLATDPMGNPVFGIPVQYLNKDPLVVAQELMKAEQIDTHGVVIEGSDYSKFIDNCINREEPLGYTGQDFQGDPGTSCMIDSDIKADYYLFFIDGRVDTGLNGYADGTGNATSATKQALAQKIVAKNKVTYLGDVEPKLEDIASGKVDGDSAPCGVNINILKVIDAITDLHSIKISDINRQCKNKLVSGSSSSSRHYAGNGSAVDIAVVDGVALSGRDAASLSIIGTAMPILSAAATSVGSFSQVGQSECSGGKVALAASVVQFSDFCTHVHLDVPPKSDPNLKISPGF
jgi:hypothetical protein